MKYVIRTYETNKNYYGLYIASKTGYEQQHKNYYMLKQKLMGIGIILFGIIAAWFAPILLSINFITLFLGITVIFTKDRAFGDLFKED
jgi:hypothetical protein